MQLSVTRNVEPEYVLVLKHTFAKQRCWHVGNDQRNRGGVPVLNHTLRAGRWHRVEAAAAAIAVEREGETLRTGVRCAE